MRQPFVIASTIIVLCCFLSEVAASEEAAYDKRKEIEARKYSSDCFDGPDALSCLSERGFTCEAIGSNGAERYFCRLDEKRGRYEAEIFRKDSVWDGTIRWVPESVRKTNQQDSR